MVRENSLPARAASTARPQARSSSRQVVVLVVRKHQDKWQVLVPLYGEQLVPVLGTISTKERTQKPVITTAAEFAAAVLGVRLSQDRFVVIFATSTQGLVNGVVLCMGELQPDEADRIRLGYGEPVWWDIDHLLDAKGVGKVMSVWMHELKRHLQTRA